MFTVTEEAGARLASKLEKKEPGMALRFVRDDERGGWAVRPDKATKTDTAFAHKGHNVLVIDEESSDLLKNKILGIKETDEGPRLRLYGR